MKLKKIISIILIPLWMLLIFFFSSQNGMVSEANSDQVASKIIDVATSIMKKDISLDQKQELIEESRVYIRKSAHFTLYFILNILVYFTLKIYGVKYSFLLSVLFCFLFACTDEFHQLFVSERTGKILDVFIDTTGAIMSSFLLFLMQSIKKVEEKKS